MGSYRLNPNDVMLLSSESSAIGQYEAAVSGVKIADLDPEFAFQNVFTRLRPGDSVRVICFAPVGADRRGRVTEVALFRILTKTSEADRTKGVQARLGFAEMPTERFTVPDPDAPVKPVDNKSAMFKRSAGKNAWDIFDADTGAVLEQVGGSAKEASEYIAKSGGVEVEPPKAKAA